MIDYPERFQLTGKVAYIVGGGGLIGKEVTTAIAMAGAKTIILDINAKVGLDLAESLTKSGYNAVYHRFNSAEMDKLDQQYQKVQQAYGPNDIFINCSYPRSVDWAKSTFKNVSLESFRENVDIHMNSYAWLAKLAAEAMLKAGTEGSIIQFGSTYGVVGQDLTVYAGTDMGENMTYAAIKGGITNLTRQMASYYGSYGIRINTICPGGISGHVAGKSDSQNPIFVKSYCDKTPLKRMGRPEDIASSVLFLASEAAAYITGTTLMVDGGWTAV
jgi:NAD(P)-dependent dehydrogenase (short-subunit alcohol dehydrogenase family)